MSLDLESIDKKEKKAFIIKNCETNKMILEMQVENM